MAGYDPYGTAASGSGYGMAPDLQFYSGAGAAGASGPASGMGASGSGSGVNAGLYGDATGSMQSMGGSSGIGGVMLQQGGFWSAFTAAPVYENEPPLLEGASGI